MNGAAAPPPRLAAMRPIMAALEPRVEAKRFGMGATSEPRQGFLVVLLIYQKT